MDRINIIRNRIADLRSEKYVYLDKWLEKYEYPESEIAEERRNLLNYLENQILAEGLEYNVAEEQKHMDFGKIYTGESLREYINSISTPEESDKSVSRIREKRNYTAAR
ncbi:hypothetical protein [uncultured Cloacibacillus sp.]|uniref:hypothetical protein n=1 Tax=uncultured Cloacibacillus sp. TaxID=889794 RepID=UPI00262EEE4E|nr:hypothetical protein [uncultured Cloacibacillus sp.]